MPRRAKSLNRSPRRYGGLLSLALPLAALLAIGACSDGPTAPVETEPGILAPDNLDATSSTRPGEECDPLFEVGMTCDDPHDPIGGDDPGCDPYARACGSFGGGGGGGAAPGSLLNDEVPGSQTSTPNCTLSPNQLHRVQQEWCNGDRPNSTYTGILTTAAESIMGRCSYLVDDWLRVQGNIRLFHWSGEGGGGGAPVGGIWLLVSYEWLDADPELSLAHELLHIAGYSHDAETGNPSQFQSLERTCSGGRNT